MLRSRVESELEWDAFVGSNPDGYHEQCSDYAALRREFGFRCARTVVRDASGHVVGGVQVLYQKTPVGRLGLVLRGPVAQGDDPETLLRVVASMTKLARLNMLSSIRVETFPTQVRAREALTSAGYRSSEAWSEDRLSGFIDLQMEDDAMLAKMKPKARRQIRDAARKGVKVIIGSSRNLRDFYDLHHLTAEHQGFPVFPESYYNYLRDIFGANRLPIFLATYNDKSVMALMGLVMGNRLYYCWGGMHRGAEEKKLNANRLLHFEAMKWGRAMGLEGYDLGGTSLLKNQLAHYTIQWPRAQRRLFGPAKALRHSIIEYAWRTDPFRALIEKGARRLGYRQQMPY